MKQLNFSPYYEDLLVRRAKTTTFRMPSESNLLSEGERVTITVGWPGGPYKELRNVTVMNVYEKCIHELNALDFSGESPDCQTPEATALVLSAIYKQLITVNTKIRIVKFRHDPS
jgi:hypothetical protein